MGRANHLSKAEKELIAFNYRKSGKSLGSIAKFLNRSKMSVSRYKNFKLPRIVKESKKSYDTPQEQTIDVTNEQWFKDIYQFFVTKAGYEDTPSQFFVIVKNRFWEYYKKQILSCPNYKRKLKVDIIRDIVDLLRKEYIKDHNIGTPVK